MADIQTLKKLLAEEYGITTARELDEAMKKIGGWRSRRRVICSTNTTGSGSRRPTSSTWTE